MKTTFYTLLTALLFILTTNIFAQTGFSGTVGYSPWQSIETGGVVSKKGHTIHADVQMSYGFLDAEDFVDIGIIGGIGIRSYNMDGLTITSSDEYQKRLTRFDLHVGPFLYLGMEERMFGILLHPQIGWGFGGYRDDSAPKSYFACTINADIVIANWVIVGVAYRPLANTIRSSEFTDPYGYTQYGTNHRIKPAFEFRVGIMHTLMY